jgi:nucleotide-binding universal stress UspA family protein
MTDADANAEKTTKAPFKIVVGIETDDTGDNAINYAIDLAKRFGGELHICHSSKSNTEDPEKVSALLDATLEKLKTFLANTISEAGLVKETTLHPGLGEPAKVLEQLAIDLEADLIIVGTHGRRGMRRLVQGSVANQLVLSAPCPVAVAIPREFEGLEKSPAIEPSPPHAQSYINHPHTYHYRRSIGVSRVDANINPSGMPSRGF